MRILVRVCKGTIQHLRVKEAPVAKPIRVGYLRYLVYTSVVIV